MLVISELDNSKNKNLKQTKWLKDNKLDKLVRISY